MDQHLAWNTHIAHILKKGANWSSQIRQAVAPSWELTLKYAHKMYCSVAIPRILYMADVWGVPKPLEGLAAHKKGTSMAIMKLTSTQRMGVLAATGGLSANMTIPLANYIQATGRFKQEAYQGRTMGGGDNQHQGLQTQHPQHTGPNR